MENFFIICPIFSIKFSLATFVGIIFHENSMRQRLVDFPSKNSIYNLSKIFSNGLSRELASVIIRWISISNIGW